MLRCIFLIWGNNKASCVIYMYLIEIRQNFIELLNFGGMAHILKTFSCQFYTDRLYVDISRLIKKSLSFKNCILFYM